MMFVPPIKKITAFALLCALAGCSSVNRTTDGLPAHQGVTPVVAANKPTAGVTTPVAIIVGRAATHDELIAQLKTRLAYQQRAVVKYSLANASAQVIEELIAQREITDVVLIGPDAARAFTEVDLPDLIYCRVLDETPLLNRGYRGVAALPPFRVQLQQWRASQPDLEAVGAITSAHLSHYTDELLEAGNSLGITVNHTIVDSDIQALYEFKRIAPSIDGFLLLPDHRILSPATVQEILAYADKNQISVLSFNKAFEELGTTLAVATDEGDIADQVMALLQDDDAQRKPLTQAVIAQTKPSESS